MQTATPILHARLKLVLVFFFTYQFSYAQFVYESFQYGIGPGKLDSLSASWSAHRGGGNNTIKYEPSSLIAPIGLPQDSGGCARFIGGAGSREDLNRSFTPQNTGAIYISFLVNIDSTNGEYFFHLNPFTHIGRIFTRKQNNQLQIACSKIGTPITYNGNYQFNASYLLVLKYEFVAGTANDTVSLWVLSEPSSTEAEAGIPNNKDHSGNDPANIFAACIRQGTNMVNGRIDELRIAQNWEDAVGTSVWNGSIWQGPPPNAQTNVKIMGNFTPDTTFRVNNMHINGNQKLTLNGKELHLYGKLSGVGKVAGLNNAGIQIYSEAGTLLIDSAQASFKTLQLHPNASLILASTLKLQPGLNAGTLTLNSHASLQTNNHLVFQSNAFGSARLASLGSGAVLSGKITVEKYIPARRAFRFLSTPVTTENGLINAWQQQIHITGNGLGFDSTASKNPSLFSLNVATQNWQAFTNSVTENLMQGHGYRLLVRGDRSINLFSNIATPTAVVLAATGFHQTGDKTYNASSTPAIGDSIGAWSLIGNPFPSSINWDWVSKINIANTYYTWRAQGGSNNRGAYVNYNALGQTSSDGNINGIISSGAAVMIKTIGNNPSLTIKESDKVATNEGSHILGKNTLPSLRIKLYEYDSVLTDALFIYAQTNAVNTKDVFDSEKWMNPGTSLYSVDSLNNAYSIMAISQNQMPKKISLKLTNTEIKSYQFKIHANNLFEKNWWLIDQYLGKEILLDTFTQYVFEITENKASLDENRFILNKEIGLNNSIVETDLPSFNLYPNPSKGQFQLSTAQYQDHTINYAISNLQGQILHTGELPDNKKIDCNGIGSGLFILNLQTDKYALSFKIMIE